LPEDRRARFLKDLRRLVVGAAPGEKAKGKKKRKGARKDGESPAPETTPGSGS
jgi:hypothetical protein